MEKTETLAQESKNFYSPKFGNVTDIVWDGDNTIWDWVKYAVHAYEAMSQTIADETDKPEPEVAAAMKRFYTSVGTMEHEGLIQGLEAEGLFANLPNYNRDQIIQKAQKVFAETRHKHLHLYPNLRPTLKTTSEHGIKNTILTDAPSFQARMRIRRFKIDTYIARLNAMPAAKIQLPQYLLDRQSQGKYSIDFDVTEIPLEKPFSNLEKILNMPRDQIRDHVIIIGDNDGKDMELARIYGCRGIHAVYGKAGKKMLTRLLRFSPEKVAGKNIAVPQKHKISPQSTKNIITISDPKRILEILNFVAET